MANQSRDGVRTNIYLARPQHEAVHALANATGISFTEHIRRSVDFYLAFSDDIRKAVEEIKGLDGGPGQG